MVCRVRALLLFHASLLLFSLLDHLTSSQAFVHSIPSKLSLPLCIYEILRFMISTLDYFSASFLLSTSLSELFLNISYAVLMHPISLQPEVFWIVLFHRHIEQVLFIAPSE